MTKTSAVKDTNALTILQKSVVLTLTTRRCSITNGSTSRR